MVRGNQLVSNGHFHKDWQSYLKTWFRQPAKKHRRANLRTKKSIRVAPRPSKAPLRPIVNCPSFRYNNKVRLGRGFSLRELKQAKINPKFARSVGIAVDKKRITKSYEALSRNVQRLKEYMGRLILFPKKEKEEEKKWKKTEKTVTGRVMPIKKSTDFKIKSRVITQEDRKFSPYLTLKKERSVSKKKFKKNVELKAKTDP